MPSNLIDEAERLAADLSPRDWVCTRHNIETLISNFAIVEPAGVGSHAPVAYVAYKSDGDFIARSRTLLPELAALAKSALEENAKLRKLIDDHNMCCEEFGPAYACIDIPAELATGPVIKDSLTTEEGR